MKNHVTDELMQLLHSLKEVRIKLCLWSTVRQLYGFYIKQANTKY